MPMVGLGDPFLAQGNTVETVVQNSAGRLDGRYGSSNVGVVRQM